MRFLQERSSRPLDLEELHQFKWVLGCLMALLSFWTVMRLDLELGLVPVFAVLVVVAVMVKSSLPGLLPPVAWKGGVFLIVGVFLFDLVTGEIVAALLRLDLLLILYRTIQYRRKREDLQLVILALFLTVVAGVLTVSLFFAVQILLFTACAMCFLFLINLIETVESGGRRVGRRWTRLPFSRFIRRLAEVFDLRMAAFAGMLFGIVVLISTILFLSIPRFQINNPIAFLQFRPDRTLTGFSENITLGEVTDITRDNSIAMRVDLSPADAIPVVPYWRMVVLDEYAHGSLRVSNTISVEVGRKVYPVRTIEQDWNLGNVYPVGGSGDPVRWVFYLEGGVSRYLPLLGNFDRLVFKEPQDLQINEFFRILSTAKQSPLLTSFQVDGMDTTGRIPDPDLAEFDFESPESKGLRGLPPPPVDSRRKMRYPYTLLALPEGEADREYLEAAVDEITRGQDLDAAEFARRATAWLGRNHTYSMSIRLPDDGEDRDPVVRWLESRSPGHCEFFASSFILLSRAAGFPSRAVTGFKGGTWNAYEAYFMVRNSDAHAWCEVLGEDGVWFRVDPTPGVNEAIDGSLAAAAPVRLPVDTSLKAYVDSLRMLWYRQIVSFDDKSQTAVVKGVQSFGRRTVAGAVGFAGDLVRESIKWIRGPWPWQRTLLIVLVIGLVILAVRGLRWLGLGWSDLSQIVRRKIEPARLLAGRHLRRIGVVDDPDPERIAVTGDLQRIRYGQRSSWPNTREVFQRARKITN
jgi:transglutaminase-like putative cysteine protease